MSHPMEPVLFDQDDPAERGEAHGELWRSQIRQLAEIRAELCMIRGEFADRAELDRVAGAHLPGLERLEPELFAELAGIARAAGLSPAAVVILNHYSDLRDVLSSGLGRTPKPAHDPGGSTAVYTLGQDGPLLGQTWDMHGTAEPFVRMIRVKPRSRPEQEVVCFTLTGCLGMAGMGAGGVALTINDLTSTDAQIGLLWPALVRRLLLQPSAAEARDHLIGTRLSSGHHYMIADGQDFFGVETSGKIKVQNQTGARAAHVHTNHCFDPVLRQHENVSPASTTFERLNLASTLFAQQVPSTAGALWDLLTSHEGYPRSICSHVDDAAGDPSASRTCGILVMELAEGRIRTTRGCGQESDPILVQVDGWPGLAAGGTP